MLFHQYQHEAHKFSNPDLAKPMQTAMACMGLAGEAGELIDELKKFLFHSKDFDREKIIKEIGDVLWYLAEVATCFEIPLSDAALTNIAKLRKRHGGETFKPHNEQLREDKK